MNGLWTTRLFFLRSYSSASRPLPPTLSVSNLHLFLSLPACRLLREGGGRGAKSCDGEITWSSINYSILSNGEDIEWECTV
jgi:hypothetical protein